MLYRDRFVSRFTFCKELYVGEGAVKTLILHLKSAGLADSTRAGTFLTGRGRALSESILDAIVGEAVVGKTRMCNGRYGHAVMIRDFAHAIRTGVEQRDFAILYGARMVLTMIFDGGRFSFPGEAGDALDGDGKTRDILMGMSPEDGDVVIMTSADDPFVAEASAKNSALCTIAAS